MDKDNYGWTSFLFAGRYGQSDVVKLLSETFLDTFWIRFLLN